MKKSLKNVRIEPVELENLYRFASGFADSDGRRSTAPITLARAKAQMENPAASKSDTVLFAAFDGSRCIGYHGQLPGLLLSEEGVSPVLWGSTFFVLDEYRGKGLGQAFLENVAALDRDFVATRFTPHARKALLGFGLKILGRLTYYQLRVERSHVSKRPFDLAKRFLEPAGDRPFEETRALEKIAADFEKRLFYAAIGGKTKKLLGGYAMERIDRLAEADFFPGRPPSQPCFLRNAEIVDWMLSRKWVYSESEKKGEAGTYHFSGARDLFAYFPLKLYFRKNGEYRGFLVLCVSARKGRTLVRVLDNRLKTEDDMDAACGAALLHARKYGADRVEFPREWGERLKGMPVFRPFLKKQEREYLYFSKRENGFLERYRNTIQLDYCDGDVAFT